MAAETKSMSLSRNLPPRQIEGYLMVKKKVSCPIPSRKYYSVLFGDVLQLFDNERSYSQRQQNPKEQIDLQKVSSISETIQVIKGQKTNTDFCFKVELLDQNEVVFSTKSKEDVKDWVECLKHTKLFYENCSERKSEDKPFINSENNRNKDSINTDQSDCSNEIKPQDIDPSHMSLSIIMSHGCKYTANMAPDGDLDNLWTAVLNSLPGHYCEKCQNCQLRRSTMELWTVNEDGVACKVDESCTDYKRDIYLLEHNYKLLVVFFEDSTFLVSPVDMSIKSKEVPEIELFARKLTSIDCSNAQLYLVTSSKSVTPFSPDEQPLIDYFWEQRGSQWSHRNRKGDKLLLKTRALVIPLNSRTTAEKCQELKAKKMFEERRQKIAIKEIEKTQVQKQALKTINAADTSVKMFNDWSKTSIAERKAKATKPCVINVPSESYPLNSQRSVPFDYLSDDENSNRQNDKTRTVSEGDKTAMEKVNVKKRSTSDANSLLRRGAVRRRRHTVPYHDITTTERLQLLSDNIVDHEDENDCENVEEKDSSPTLNRLEAPSVDLLDYEDGKENDSTNIDILENNNKQDCKKFGQNDCVLANDQQDFKHDETSVISSKGVDAFLSSAVNDSSSSSSENIENTSTNNQHSNAFFKSEKTVKQLDNSSHSDEMDGPETRQSLSDEKISHDGKESCSHDVNIQIETRQSLSDEKISHDGEESCSHDINVQITNSTIDKDSCSVQKPRHCCDYYTVESPQVLKPILDQYSRLKKGQVEVNCVCPPQNLCLSSIHVVNNYGHWVLEDEENVSIDSQVGNCDVFFLQSDIKVIFDPSTRMWTVQRVQVDKTDEPSVHQEKPNFIDNNNQPDTIDVFLLSKKTDYPQLTMLDNSIQKIFYQVSLAEDLDDIKYPDIRKVVCVDFCSALHSLLIHGLKKRRTLFGATKYTVWEVIESCTTACQSIVVVQKINRLGQLEDKTRLELFVCECLNTGSDALAEWYEYFQKQNLTSFYGENAIVRTIDRDILVQKLSRLTSLPFKLTYFDEIQKLLKEKRQLAFTFE